MSDSRRVTPAHVACVALGLAFAGCSTWHVARLAAPAPPAAGDSSSPRAADPSRELGDVRIRRGDGSTVELRHARFEGDSLVGWTRRTSLSGTGPGRVAVARADVRQIHQWRFSMVRTTGLLLLVATTGGVLLRALFGGFGGNASD